MINGKPQQQDFQFQHKGIFYAIGYQETDETFALSANVGGNWGWEITEPCYEQHISDKGGFSEYLDQFLEKVNKKVFSDEPAPTPATELDKLIQETGKLVYTSTGIVRG